MKLTEEDLISDYMASREEFDNPRTEKFSSPTEAINQIQSAVSDILEALDWLDDQLVYGYTSQDGIHKTHVKCFRHELEFLADLHMDKIIQLEED